MQAYQEDQAVEVSTTTTSTTTPREVEKTGYAVTTPQEDEAVATLRATFPDSEFVKNLNDTMLLRYVRARSTLDESIAILKTTIEWRAENKPEEMRLQKASFEPVLKSGLVYWHKHDKQGRPCVVVFPRQHFPGKTTLECTYQACVYFLESARNKVLNEGGPSQYVLIYDMKDFSFTKNMDVEAIRKLSKLQDVYPELLGAAYLINTPWLVSTLMKLLYAVMTKQTMAKVKLLSGNGKEELREYFDEDCLLPEHGGTSDYVYQYDPSSDA